MIRGKVVEIAVSIPQQDGSFENLRILKTEGRFIEGDMVCVTSTSPILLAEERYLELLSTIYFALRPAVAVSSLFLPR
jgi:hypothetical protein